MESPWSFTGAQSIPLLPFERQLIEQLGCTKEEYREFSRQVRQAAKHRPAAYDHVPDIQNVEWVALALTILSTGFQVAAHLLAPKPRESRKGRAIAGSDLRGRQRFSPTTGFDSLQELAEYGSVIPVVFTKRVEASAEAMKAGAESGTGGILASPQLVWSRVVSLGSYQIVEQQFILGQGPIDAPFSGASNAVGIFLGNNFLDLGSPEEYAIYYRDGSALDNRMGREHLIAGSLTATESFPFTAPTSAGEVVGASSREGLTSREPLAFCSTFTPSNKTEFGVYGAIPNGTSLRLPWQIASVALDVDDPDYSPFNERKWISGVEASRDTEEVIRFMKRDGMSGTGMNYARRCGIWDIGGTGIVEVASLSKEKYKIYEADIGAKITVTVGTPERQDLSFEPSFASKDTTNNGADIRSTLEDEHARADEGLQVGDQVVIGTGLWKVVNKRLAGSTSTIETAWDIGKQLLVEMECIKSLSGYGMASGGLFSKVRFGVPAKKVLTINPAIGRCLTNDDDFDKKNGNIPGEDETKVDYVLSETFFPICKAELASFENTMSCDVTEIGIKSQVWTRLNGLTNFTKLPSPDDLLAADEKNNTYGTGSVTRYAKRVSLFSLDVRKAGSLPDAQWTPVGETFAVVGQVPRDQFNYIRVYHPQKIALEFRLRPRNSAEFTYLIDSAEFTVIVLDASKDTVETWTAPGTAPGLSGPVRVLVSGTRQKLRDIEDVRRLSNKYKEKKTTTTNQAGTLLFTSARYRPGTGGSTGTSPSVEEISDGLRFLLAYRRFYGANLDTSPPMDIDSTAPSPAGPGYYSGKESWQKANPNEYRPGDTIKATEKYRPGTSKEITIQFTLRNETTITYRQVWTLQSVTVISSANGFAVNELVYKGLILGYVGSSSTFKSPVLELVFSVASLRSVTETTVVREVDREFESHTAIAELTHYPGQISKSCDDSPEHAVVYVNESLAEYSADDGFGRYSRCAMIGLKLKSSRRFTQLDQLRIYLKSGTKMTNLLSPSSSQSSNLFTDLAYYLLTNKETGAGNFLEGLVDTEQMTLTSKFLQNNGLFYSGTLSEQVNLRSFLGEIAPSMLCNLVIRNGRFSVEPALPIDSDGSVITGAVPFSAMFTSGNILDDTFGVEYLAAEEREDFTAVVRYREEVVNQLPQSRSVIVRYTSSVLGTTTEPPIEEFDLPFITSRAHAILVAKFFLAARKRITHTISFKTTPMGSALSPGAFIRVVTESNPYSPSNNGIITADKTVISARPLIESGEATYDVYAWTKTSDEVVSTTIKVKKESSGAIKSIDGPYDCIFAIKESAVQSNCYVVEAVEFEEDGIIKVTASVFPVDSTGKSVITNEVLGLTPPSPFVIEEL